MASFCNALDLNPEITIIVLRNFDVSCLINNVISIIANFANLMIRRFKNSMIQNPENKLHDLLDSFLPIKHILETENTKILFLCLDITSESIEFIKLSYPESEFIKYKVITEETCFQEYPNIFTKINTPISPVIADNTTDLYNSQPFSQLFDDNISCILPNQLYLTGDIGARNFAEIIRLNISHIINVSDTLENYFENELDFQGGTRFKYLKISIPDSPTIIITDYFPSGFKFIEDAITNRGKVLVHCFAGKSRSASIIIGYLMKTQKIKCDDAIKLVAKSRPCIEPNIGFLTQLLQYETTL